jgi:hypothetical protein
MSATMNAIVLILFLGSLGGFILGRIMQWKRVWVVSLIVFVIMIIAIFILWYCFPKLWDEIVMQIKSAW